jgi:hypothetical protein
MEKTINTNELLKVIKQHLLDNHRVYVTTTHGDYRMFVSGEGLAELTLRNIHTGYIPAVDEVLRCTKWGNRQTARGGNTHNEMSHRFVNINYDCTDFTRIDIHYPLGSPVINPNPKAARETDHEIDIAGAMQALQEYIEHHELTRDKK